MSRQRVYIESAYADILRILGDKLGVDKLGVVLESTVDAYLQQNHIELKELLDDRKRETGLR
jgi:hypothetical protein